MKKSCPPGMLCIENCVFTFLFIIMFIILLIMYIKNNKNTNINTSQPKSFNYTNEYYNNIPRYDTNIFKDVLLDPHHPPVKNDMIYSNLNNVKLMPVNVATQSVKTDYRQVGILTRVNADDTILPLMGKPLITNRDKWNYYTMNDKNNTIKLPIIFRNKSCTSQQGCDSLYDGDTVYVQGYKDLFRVTLYDNNSLEYIPYL